MPNHVTNKLIMSCADAAAVIAECVTNGTLDFNKLVPQPPHIYLGNLGKDDDEDFKCNWDTWNRVNWGTKWGAYDGSIKTDDGVACIQFDTAWSVPYPVLAALANRYKSEFEHRYFDEGHNFWGVEKWRGGSRISKHRSHADDLVPLCMELKGYDPNNQDDD